LKNRNDTSTPEIRELLYYNFWECGMKNPLPKPDDPMSEYENGKTAGWLM